MFYSQFGEDKLLNEIFGEKNDGYCIEVGANDGINDSNTFYFEKQGWDCVLVEPNPDLCESIRKFRRATLYEVAASSGKGQVELLIASGAERAHGVSAIDAQNAAQRIKDYGFSYERRIVSTNTLDDILSQFNSDKGLDFITIDVEGHEMEVLNGFNLNRWRPRICIIEDNSGFLDNKVSKHMKKNGYIPFKITGVNVWYADRLDEEILSYNLILRFQAAKIMKWLKNKIKKDLPVLVRIKRFLRR